MCSPEYHSFHSFERRTLKELFFLFLFSSFFDSFLLLVFHFFSSLSPSFNYMTRDSTRGWCAIGETTASNKHRFSRFSYQGRKRGAALFFAIFSDDFVPTQSSAIYEARGPVQARTQISSMALNLKQQKTTAGRRGKDERRNNGRDKERWKDEKQNVYRRDIPQETRQ